MGVNTELTVLPAPVLGAGDRRRPAPVLGA